MEVRYRGKTLRRVVEDLDAFPKCQETVQEEKRTSGALVAIICFCLTLWLLIGEVRDYMQGHVQYKFLIDVNYNSSMMLDVDLVIAMPCGAITADVSNVVQPESKEDNSASGDPMKRNDSSIAFDGDEEAFRELLPMMGGGGPGGMFGDEGEQLQRTNTRFELTDDESKYWKLLKQAQRSQESTHGRYAAVNDLLYVRSSVLQSLDELEAIKNREEAKDAPEQQPVHRQMIMFSGGGMFMQVINPQLDPGSSGTACRIHGVVPIRKTTGTLEIMAGQKINMGPLQGRINMMDRTAFNFSHRIAHLGFGPRLPGLVLPLAGTDKTAADNMDLYQYYLKVVPTRLNRRLGQPITTYQYSVTHTKRTIDHHSGSHGMPGIVFKYELTPIMVEIRVPDDHTIIRLMIRLCSIAGGLFATSCVLYSLAATVISLCAGPSVDDAKKKLIAHGSPSKQDM